MHIIGIREICAQCGSFKQKTYASLSKIQVVVCQFWYIGTETDDQQPDFTLKFLVCLKCVTVCALSQAFGAI